MLFFPTRVKLVHATAVQAQPCGRVFEDSGTYALDEMITPDCHPRLTLAVTSVSNILVTLVDIQSDGPAGIITRGSELAEGAEYCMPSGSILQLGAPSTAGNVHFRGTLRYRPTPDSCGQIPATPTTAPQVPLLGRFLFPSSGPSATNTMGWMTDTVLYVIDNSGLGHIMLYDTSKNFSLVGHLKGLDGAGPAQFSGARIVKATALHPPIVQSNAWYSNRGFVMMLPRDCAVGELTVSAATAAVGNTPTGSFGQQLYFLSNGDVLIMGFGFKGDDGTLTNAGLVRHCRPGACLGVSNSFYFPRTNSLVGEVSLSLIGYAQTGATSITELHDGNYLVLSSCRYADAASSSAGAATWCAAGVGCTGVVNGNHPTSLVGSSANDKVGAYVWVLSDGTYVVSSPSWSSNRGFVAVGNSTHPVVGVVGAANSLVGTTAGDQVGYVASSFFWNCMGFMDNGDFLMTTRSWTNPATGKASAGAIAFFSPRAGIVPVGPIDETNALGPTCNPHLVPRLVWVVFVAGQIGTTADFTLGTFTYLPVSRSYVIIGSPSGTNYGYAHWCSGCVGKISDLAQVRGTATLKLTLFVRILTNGNFVLYSPTWKSLGFAMLCTGAAGCPSSISSATALVGGASGDAVSQQGILALSDGGYVVGSTGLWGAVTYCPPSGCQGVLSETNSLIWLGVTSSQLALTMITMPWGGFALSCPTCLRSGLTNSGIVARMVFTAPGYMGKGAVFFVPSTEFPYGLGSSCGLLGDVTNPLVRVLTPKPPSPKGACAHIAGALFNGSDPLRVSVADHHQSRSRRRGGAQTGNCVITVTPNGDYVIFSPASSTLTWCSGETGCRGLTVSEADTITGVTANPTMKTRPDGDYYLVVGTSFICQHHHVEAPKAPIRSDARRTNKTHSAMRASPSNPNDPSPRHSPLPDATAAGAPRTGLPKGPLGPTTALTGITSQVRVTSLTNGAFLVTDDQSLSTAGSVTWCSGTDYCVGTVSETRSLIGAATGHKVGAIGTIILSPDLRQYIVRWIRSDSMASSMTVVACSTSTIYNIYDVIMLWNGVQVNDLALSFPFILKKTCPTIIPQQSVVVRLSSCPTASGCTGVVTNASIALVGTSTLAFSATLPIRFLPNGNMIFQASSQTFTLCVPGVACSGTLSAANTFGYDSATGVFMPPAGSPEYAASSFYAAVPSAVGGVGAVRLCSGVTFDCATTASFTAANSALGSAAHPTLGSSLSMGPNGFWVGHRSPAALSYLPLVNGQLPLGTAVTEDNCIVGLTGSLRVDAATGILVDSGSTRSVQVGLTRQYHSHFEQVAAETDGERVVMRFWVDEPVRMVGWTATMKVTHPETLENVTQNLVFDQTGRATVTNCSLCTFEAGSFPAGKKYPARISLSPAVFFDKPVWDTVLNFALAFDRVTPFTPANCYAGVSEPCEVHIKAKHYSLPAQVTLDGQPCQVLDDSTTSDLHVRLPAISTAGMYALTLSSDGAQASANFTYLGPDHPVIYSALPACPPEGCNITITGTGFYNPTVTYGHVPVTCPSWTRTAIICQMPVAVFDLVHPRIASVDPQVEATGGDITIHGADFVNVTVTMEGRPCPLQSTTPSMIVCTAPPAPKERCRLTVQTGAPGQHSGTATYTYKLRRPVIASVGPACSLLGGCVITITGSEFVDPTVTLASAPLNCMASTATEINCTVPAGTAEPANLTLINLGGYAASVTYTYDVRRPVIASVGPACSLLGGCVVTITGSDFDSPTVTLASAPLTCTAATATEVNCTVPAGTAEHSNLTLINLGGYADSVTYTYDVRRPVIASVGPACSLLGGCVTTITGTDFDSPTVQLASAPLTCTAATATEINCTVPAGTSAQANLTLINLGGYAASVMYTYQVRTPILSGCTPASCPAATGCLLALSGSAFELPAVTLGGTVACTLVSAGPTRILAQCGPSALRGPQNLTVTNTGGHQASRIITVQGPPARPQQSKASISGFWVLDPSFAISPLPHLLSPTGAAPSFTAASVTPSAGPALVAAPASLTIAGAGFWADPASGSCPTAAIGAAACTVTACTATSLTCVLPASSTGQPLGAADLVVTNPDGVSGTLGGAYTFQGAWPALSAISPATGPLAGGQLVTVVGTGMRAGARVTLGGAACTGVALGSGTSSLTCTTPAGGVAGLVDVTLTNSDLTSATLAAAYAYQGAVPTLGQVWPVSGPTSGATGLTLSGTGFRAGATVLLGSLPCTGLVVHNQTAITCTSPPGAEAKVNVTVTNADLTSVTLPQAFEFTHVGEMKNVRKEAGAGRSKLAHVTRLDLWQMVFSGLPYVYHFSSLPTSARSSVTWYPPVFISISPATCRATSSLTVTLICSNIRAGVTVTIGGRSCTGASIIGGLLFPTICSLCSAWSDGDAQGPASGAGGTVGSADVTVRNTDGLTTTAVGAFTFTGPDPAVGGVSPSTLAAASGPTTITVTGSDFRPGCTVLVGSLPCTGIVIAADGNSLQCTLNPPPPPPPLPLPLVRRGCVSVSVCVCPEDGCARLVMASEAPTLSGVSPRRGSFKAATRVTLTGTHLRANATVLVGGRACLEVEVLTGETVRAYVPPPPEGTPTGADWVTDVQLLNYDMTSATLGDAFTYVAATATAEGDDLAGWVSGGSLALIVVGALMLMGVLLAVLAVFLVQRRRRHRSAALFPISSVSPNSTADAEAGPGAESPKDSRSKGGDLEMEQMSPTAAFVLLTPRPMAETIAYPPPVPKNYFASAAAAATS
ncbi:putative phospholipase D [Paratrimastix pyriformis]|uniref:Phospholipase D n=1 Tax=Paratrimastix pyriformis TaxID=342808 RepID=A0ABQ8UFS1_9EUKA|nr:putative phospholipase D [Paratrimastix pyriformis]